ncbi:MAG: hypothetical protein ACR2ID_10190 [Chthoniobacterales bacterium]
MGSSPTQPTAPQLLQRDRTSYLAVVLMLAVRTVLSTAVAGYAAGSGGLGWIKLGSSPLFSVHESHKPLFVFAVGMRIFTIAPVSHANSYLAA